MQHTYLLVGVSQSGVSTASNCLLNKNAKLNYINEPFKKLNSRISIKTNSDGDRIIDIKGLYENESKQFIEIKQELAKNKILKIDFLVFVFREGLFKKENYDLIQKVKAEFASLNKDNKVILIITNCQKKGWVESQTDNAFLEDALELCNRRYIEFMLYFEEQDDDDVCKKVFFNKRKKEIDNLISKFEEYSINVKLEPKNQASNDYVEAKPTTTKNKIESNIDNKIRPKDYADCVETKPTSKIQIELGYYLRKSGFKLNSFESKLIDMSFWNTDLRNEITAKIIARAWYIIRKYVLNDIEFTKSEFNTENKIYENVYAGDEQSMKTPVQLAIQYFITLAFSTIGVMVVRNNGGRDQIDKCKNYLFSAKVNGNPYEGKLNEIIKEVLENEYKNEWSKLDNYQKKIFDIKMLDTYDLDENELNRTDKSYGHLTNLFMLIGLYNRTFIDKIADVLVPSNSKDVNKFKNGSSLFRYGLIIDEEDELMVSFDREKGATERAMFTNKREKLDDLPIRFASSFIFSTTATFFNIVYYDDTIIKSIFEEFEISKELVSNVMVKSLPENYYGFSENCENKIEIRIIQFSERNEDAYGTNEFDSLDKEVKDGFLDHRNVKCLHLFFKKHLPLRYDDPTLKQLSILVSLGAIRINDNQDLLSETIIREINRKFPALCFSYNQKEEMKLFTNQPLDQNKVVEILFKLRISYLDIKPWPLNTQSKNINSIQIIFSKKMFLKHYYDIAQEICSRFKNKEGKPVKPVIICCAGILSNRCLTFKDSKLEFPLTDQYYSPTLLKSGLISASFNLDAKQTFSRIAGVDNQNFTRCLWIPDLIKNKVLESIKVYDDLKKLHSTNRGVDWKTCLTHHLKEKYKTLYKSLTNEVNITKKNIMKDLRKSLPDLNIEETLSSEKNLDFLKNVLKKEMKFNDLFSHMVRNDLFVLSEDKKFFTYVQLKGQNEHNSKRESLRQALDSFTELHFEDENNGDIYYFYDPDK